MVEYFVDHRQMQVNELAASLSQLASEKNLVYQSLDQIEIQNQSRRKILKKLLSFMTIGLDLSQLFPHVVMISSTSDPVQKKIIYQYIMEYAGSNEDLAILAINAMQKDSKDPDPSIRSLAIKSLCALKTINYSLPIVKNALSDTSFIVQNAAIIGSIRLMLQEYDLSIPVLSKYLRKSINSDNTSVVFNAFFAISYMEQLKGFPVELSRMSTLHLINTFKYFNEWNQNMLLNIFSTFKPQSEEELFNILNQLDYLLSLNSTSLVLGCSKCFLMWTKDYPNLSSHIIKRISKPLITLASTSCPESAHIIYEHLLQIISNITAEDKLIFDESFILFYLKHNDTSQIQSLKLQILSEIINDGNYEFILEHIQFYLNYQSISEQIFPIMVKIGIKYPDTVDGILDLLKTCLEFENKDIVSYSMESIKHLVIYYPKYATNVLLHIEDIKQSLTTYKSKASYISLIGTAYNEIGEFGHDVDTSPYVISEYLELCVLGNKYECDFITFVEELLVASVKLFITRSPEIVESLTKIIGFIVEDNICPYLIDRSGLYYKLLHCEDTTTLSNLIFGAKIHYSTQSKYKSQNWVNSFNTNCTLQQQVDNIDSSLVLDKISNDNSFISVCHVDSVHDIFNPLKIPRLIKPKSITPTDFEDKWVVLDGPKGQSYKFNKAIINPVCGIDCYKMDKSHIDNTLSEMNIGIIASGHTESEIKYFLYCSDEMGSDYYMQLIVDDQINILCKTITATDSECVEILLKLIYEKIMESQQ